MFEIERLGMVLDVVIINVSVEQANLHEIVPSVLQLFLDSTYDDLDSPDTLVVENEENEVY